MNTQAELDEIWLVSWAGEWRKHVLRQISEERDRDKRIRETVPEGAD